MILYGCPATGTVSLWPVIGTFTLILYKNMVIFPVKSLLLNFLALFIFRVRNLIFSEKCDIFYFVCLL